MNSKYLPIGSVCTVKGKNKKVMIIGYYGVEFNGNLKIKDYLGCVYPEGMLLPEQTMTFNHVDIEKVDFLGYKNEDEQKFMTKFNELTGNVRDDVEEAAEFHKKNDMILTSSKSYQKLLFDENGVVMIAESIKEEPKVESNIQFDRDGYVVSVGDNKKVSNPFYREYESKSSNENNEPKNWSIFNNIIFDENGTVMGISEDKNTEEINFDKEGYVVPNDYVEVSSIDSEKGEVLEEKTEMELESPEDEKQEKTKDIFALLDLIKSRKNEN